MDDQQYEELEDLVYIFKTVRFLEEEKVQCFNFIKEIIDSEYDTKKYIKKSKRENANTNDRGF